MLRGKVFPTIVAIVVIVVIVALLTGVVPVVEGVFRLILPQFAGTKLVPLRPPGAPTLVPTEEVEGTQPADPSGPTHPVAPAEVTATAEKPTPSSSTAVITHVVEVGDTVSKLAARFNSSVAAIAEASGLEDAGQIRVGQVLTIPASSTELGTGLTLATSTPQPTATVFPPPISGPERQEARVVRVIDGDTIELQIGDATYKVRYIGIDTPETQPEEEAEWMGLEATAKNEELVGGKVVELEKDVSERDRYGRLLRYVWVGDVMINAELVRLGYAQAATFPPDVRYVALFLELQEEAREAERGLWSPMPTP